MVFNSIDFAYFLPIAFVFYWFLFNKSITQQNFFLLAASYVFYGWWDWRFLFLIAFSSLVDFLASRGMAKTADPLKRKRLLVTSLTVNLTLLGFFKYFNFFAENFSRAFSFLGHPVGSPWVLNIVLPVGISFYTFQTLSYSIDVYKKKIEPAASWPEFFAYVSFFPQLVAGPIERATSLLPQFREKRRFDPEAAEDGLKQILWGLFKKIVIADHCAVFVNDIFPNYQNLAASTLVLGAVLFAFQIYCDFSGYSDIAIGTARLFGFSLMKNFAFPYFSRDVAEFWRKWHISLSLWFRDYLYIPLGGSQGSIRCTIFNVFTIFIISGFWHGANWTFIAWGTLHALYFLPLILMKRNRIHRDTPAVGKWLPSPKEALQIATTFCLITTAWIFFRAESLSQAFSYLGRMTHPTLFSYPIAGWEPLGMRILAMMGLEWVQREKMHALQLDPTGLSRSGRWGLYYGLILCCIHFGGIEQGFIYFQF